MPSLFPWNKNNLPVQASAGAVGGPGPTSPKVIAKRTQKWQGKVLDLISAIPEPAGASALIHNTLDQVILKVEAEGVAKKDINELEAMLAKFDLGRAGMLIWQVGEVYPVWREEDGEIVWDINSPVEFFAETGKKPKQLGMNDKFQDLPPGSQFFRIWKPDPAKRHQAWSPHKAMVDLLEAMYVHQLADTAVATSRLAGAGILYWPTDLPDIDPKGGMPEPGTRQELQMELQKGMMQSINNRNSADAVVPLIVFGDPSLGDNFKPEHILLERPDDAKAFAERMNAYSQRYARGVELPIESVQGMGPANHWTAWVIKEDKWRFYIRPIVDIPAEGLTKNFLRPILREMGYKEDVVRKALIVPDGTALIEKPDKSDAAIRLAQLGIMKGDSALEETGFDPKKDWTGEDADPGKRLSEMPANFRDTSPSG